MLSKRLGSPRICALIALVTSTPWLGGCQRKPDPTTTQSEEAARAEGSASARQQQTVAATTASGPKLVPLPGGSVAVLEGYTPPVFSVPLDPPLGIFPGKGVGPIRFGATTQTIERLMGVPCVEKTERYCRYPAHAVEFALDDAGVVAEIRIHGDDRPIPGKLTETYGMYNGRFSNGGALGMYTQFVIESEGAPQRVEKLKAGEAEPFATVERHHYPDMVLEYDQLKNGNVVLAGVILKRPAASASVPAAAKPAATAKATNDAPSK